LQVWNTDTGLLRFQPPSHPGLLFAALSADGRLIASVGLDAALRIWSAETGERVGQAMVHPSWVDGGLDFHPDSRHALTICKDMTLRVWDVTTGRLAAPPAGPRGAGRRGSARPAGPPSPPAATGPSRSGTGARAGGSCRRARCPWPPTGPSRGIGPCRSARMGASSPSVAGRISTS